jgi:hypothetical protein
VPKDEADSITVGRNLEIFVKGSVVMKIFKPVLNFESKRFLCKRNSILVLILVLLSLGFLQYGIIEYKDILRRKEKFKEIEKIKVEKFINYRQYGTYGFRLLFVPSPISIFFINSGFIHDMTSYVDAGERLKLYLPLKGKNIFKMIRSNFTDFSGIILFFGTLLSILYGFDTFRGKEYMKFLSSLSSFRKVFFSMLISRVFILFLIFLSIISCALLLALVNGLFIPVDKFLFYFILMIFLVSLFFFLLGTVFSKIKSITIALTTIMSFWFVLLYFIPTSINIFIASRADLITPIYELELNKLKIIMDFEKKSIEKAGIFKSGDYVSDKKREAIFGYLNNEFVRIHSLEDKMRNQMKKNKSLFQKISCFFITTFFISLNNEISSKGYENLLEFYVYIQNNKKRFSKRIMDRVYFSNFSNVESFIKGDSNIYNSKSCLPNYFMLGLFVNLFIISSILFLSLNGFKYLLFKVADIEINNTNMQNVKFKSKEFKVFHVEGEMFNNQLFYILSGKSEKIRNMKYKYKVKLFINDVDMTDKSAKIDFLYLCRIEHIPGEIKIQHFFDLITSMMDVSNKNMKKIKSIFNINLFKKKRFKQLKKYEAGQIMLAILAMKKHSIYMINDAARGMSIDFAIHLKERMETLKEEGALVIFLTTDDILMMRSDRADTYFYETKAWSRVVDDYKRGRNNRT